MNNKFQNWHKNLQNIKHLIIAGPCSAETKEQTINTALEIAKIQTVKIFRAGLWKPRTSPNSFEGVGEKGFQWLKEIKQRTNLLTTIEVATPEHIEKALKSQAVDIFWIGARTVANPFSMQNIADALQGTDIPIMVKNPVIPELKLWLGAFERLFKNGITKTAAIHRGFYPFEKTKYRNIPKLELLIEFKTQMPHIPVIGDPSHIAGRRDLIKDVSNLLLSLNIDGLMIETHQTPFNALSDANQQITPQELKILLENLSFLDKKNDTKVDDELKKLRIGIDSIDLQLLELLAQRQKLVKQIGKIKINNNIAIFQIERWRQIIKTRLQQAEELNIDKKIVKKLLELIHNYSIELQSKMLSNKKQK